MTEENAETQQSEEKTEAREPKEISITDLELENLQNELEEYKDKYFRLLAESENSRKRLQKEKQDLIKHAVADIIVDFLGPMDHLENALKHADNMSDEIKHWAIGFNMILGHFKDILANNGVQPFDSTGNPFDPHHHEAVEVIHTDEHPAGTVVQEMQRGYRMGERTIRPARVKVAKEIPLPNEENSEEENELTEENKENNNE